MGFIVFGDEGEGFVLLVLVVVEIPELFLGLPPFDDTTETGDGKEDLHVPITAMPVGVIVPSLADILDALDKRLADLRLGRELRDRHVDNLGRNADEIIQRGHNWIDGVIEKDARRAAVVRCAEIGKTGMAG